MSTLHPHLAHWLDLAWLMLPANGRFWTCGTFPHNILDLMYMQHMKCHMAAFHKHILYSWRESALLYYDIISIQLNSGIWIHAWTDIWIDTRTEKFQYYPMFVYECLQHCYRSVNSHYFVLEDVANSLLWW